MDEVADDFHIASKLLYDHSIAQRQRQYDLAGHLSTQGAISKTRSKARTMVVGICQ